MATINATDSNLSAKMLLWHDLALGNPILTGTVTTQPSNDVFAGGARTILLLATITGTDGQLQVSVSNGTPNFGAPDVTLSMTTAAPVKYAFINTTAANPYIAVNATSTAGCTFTSVVMYVSGLFATGEGQHEATLGLAGMLDGTYTVAAVQ